MAAWPLGQTLDLERKEKISGAIKICAVSSAVDPDPNWIRIRQFCEAGSVTDSQIQKEKKKLEW